MVRAPGDIFSYMQSNKIGEKVSLFWIAWAFVAERANNFKLTDQIFSKGIKRQAEPKDLLQKRYQQFQRPYDVDRCHHLYHQCTYLGVFLPHLAP